MAHLASFNTDLGHRDGVASFRGPGCRVIPRFPRSPRPTLGALPMPVGSGKHQALDPAAWKLASNSWVKLAGKTLLAIVARQRVGSFALLLR